MISYINISDKSANEFSQVSRVFMMGNVTSNFSTQQIDADNIVHVLSCNIE